jgi:hypothetical protein
MQKAQLRLVVTQLRLLVEADPAGFEPVISCVTGRRVRPLHYGSRVADAGCCREQHGKLDGITASQPLSTVGAGDVRLRR